MRQHLSRIGLAGMAAIAVIVSIPAALPADGPTDLDRAMHASLKEVANHGVRLYNEFGDHYGCYRVFDGALRSLKPLLTTHPELQKIIDDGLAEAVQMPLPDHRAWVLRKTIDAVRDGLVPAGEKKVEPKKVIAGKDKKEVPLPAGHARVSGKVTFADGAPAFAGYMT